MRIVEKLQAGESVALISDAGTPGISDPGARIVAAIRAAGCKVIPLPGPCAATTALSASGLLDEHFLFYGFLPSKGGQRRLALEDYEVNEEWNCDKGRWAFAYAALPDRLTTPLVRDADGTLQPASWPHALAVAAAGLADARAGVLVGGRATVEDAYAYAKFARVVLGTNDVDFRARACSDEETAFLAHQVAGAGVPVSYDDLEQAPSSSSPAWSPRKSRR